MGYIYIRCHVSYENACKMGKTFNIPERDNQYATSEIKRGYFELVLEVSADQVGLIEIHILYHIILEIIKQKL